MMDDLRVNARKASLLTYCTVYLRRRNAAIRNRAHS